MCLWRAPEKYIAGAALDRAGLDSQWAWVNCSAIVWLEGVDKLEKTITVSWIEPITFRCVAQFLNQLHNRVSSADSSCYRNVFAGFVAKRAELTKGRMCPSVGLILQILKLIFFKTWK
jgi:hypothetical protein